MKVIEIIREIRELPPANGWRRFEHTGKIEVKVTVSKQ